MIMPHTSTNVFVVRLFVKRGKFWGLKEFFDQFLRLDVETDPHTGD
jgi:hypothetical protein